MADFDWLEGPVESFTCVLPHDGEHMKANDATRPSSDSWRPPRSPSRATIRLGEASGSTTRQLPARAARIPGSRPPVVPVTVEPVSLAAVLGQPQPQPMLSTWHYVEDDELLAEAEEASPEANCSARDGAKRACSRGMLLFASAPQEAHAAASLTATWPMAPLGRVWPALVVQAPPLRPDHLPCPHMWGLSMPHPHLQRDARTSRAVQPPAAEHASPAVPAPQQPSGQPPSPDRRGFSTSSSSSSFSSRSQQPSASVVLATAAWASIPRAPAVSGAAAGPVSAARASAASSLSRCKLAAAAAAAPGSGGGDGSLRRGARRWQQQGGPVGGSQHDVVYDSAASDAGEIIFL